MDKKTVSQKKYPDGVFKVACRGCHGGCMYLLSVKDGVLVKAVPDPDGPLNHGNACVKGLSIIEQLYHPDRILYPMKRAGARESGKWERISWDEAYDLIAEKFTALSKSYGPECISTFTGTGRHHTKMLKRLACVMGTPNSTSSGALICLGPRKCAGYYCCGTFAGVDYYGDVKPGGILVWGSSPDVSGPDGELQWQIKDAVKQGTQLLVVDPYPTALAKQAKIWLRLRPGTDGALALGILNIILSEDLYDHDFVDNWTYGLEELKERCAEFDLARTAQITEVPEEQIVAAAHWIATVKPLSLEWGPAFEQTVNSSGTCRAIFMIPAITGNWDVPGGFVPALNISYPVSPLPDELDKSKGKAPIRSGVTPRFDAPFAHPYELLDAMKTGTPYKIRAALVAGNNPLLSLPDTHHTYECLKALDFLVVMDIFMTPTCEMADLVLPAGLWPEVNCLLCMPELSDQVMLCQHKVLQVGEAKSDEEFYLELAKRMGLDFGAETEEEILNDILSEMSNRRPELAGVSFEDIKNRGFIDPGREYLQYQKNGGFKTPTGKFELYSTAAKEDGLDPLPSWHEGPEAPASTPELAKEFPLVLTTGKRQQQYFISNNRQIRSLRKAAPFPLVSINPKTAAAHGIAQGDWVWIESPRGKITQKADLVEGMAENVINCEMGWWYPEEPSPLHGAFESNANVLTKGDAPYDAPGAYQMRALLCRISKNENCRIEERYRKWMQNS